MAALPEDLIAPAAVPSPRPEPGPLPGPRPVPPRRRSARGARAPHRRRAARYLTLMVAMTALGVFGSVALNALAAEQSFAVRELEAEVAGLTRSADELSVEVTALESPDRLHRVARRRLGMVPADQPAFVMLPREGSADSETSSTTMAASASGE